MKEFIAAYGFPLVSSILTAVIGWVSVKIKMLYQRCADTEEKQIICKTVVDAVEQLYKDLDGEEKLQKAIEAALEMLNSRGITCTELELRLTLEAAVNALNQGGEINAVSGITI